MRWPSPISSLDATAVFSRFAPRPYRLLDVHDPMLHGTDRGPSRVHPRRADDVVRLAAFELRQRFETLLMDNNFRR
jgi:hypothetical protein